MILFSISLKIKWGWIKHDLPVYTYRFGKNVNEFEMIILEFSLFEEAEKWNCNIPAYLEYYQALSELDIRLILKF
jgi:hypothetical protein